MSNNKTVKVGEARASQLLHSQGIGAVVDLPHISVMIMGLDSWPLAACPEVTEDRLLHAVRRRLGPQVQSLRLPPPAPDDNPMYNAFHTPVGLPVAPFPGWMVCPSCHLLAHVNGGLFKLRRDGVRSGKNRFVHEGCSRQKRRPPTVGPARFLVACPKGHLDDFPWHWFLHQGRVCHGALRLQDFGLSGEFGSVRLSCDACKVRPRLMTEAFGEMGKKSMPQCRGLHPHLHRPPEGCDQQMRTLTLGASNGWFSMKLSVLTIPEDKDPLVLIVEQHWERFKKMESLGVLKVIFEHTPELEELKELDYTPEQYLACINAVRAALETKSSGQSSTEAPDLATPEFKMLSKADPNLCSNDFQVVEEEVPGGYKNWIEKVVLVKRLREVSALTGFTRLDAPDKFEGSPEMDKVASVPLSAGKPYFTPVAETRGEGIFIQFREDKIQEWHDLEAVARRSLQFRLAHIGWREVRHFANPEEGFRHMRYVFLHSFAHALIRQMTLACGYETASIREKIYSAGPGDEGGPQAAVLLFTAQSDSEGTLGGLVAQGKKERLSDLLGQALERARLCSSDPLCAEHDPGGDHQGTLHGACCHACLFLPEVSCECGNRYLDRSTLTPTLQREDLAFFGDVDHYWEDEVQ